MTIFCEKIANQLVMNKLEKLKLIRELCEEHNITGYEIGKHTKISSFAAHKILNGETKNPNESTVDIILAFIEDSIVGTNIKRAEEPKSDYQTKRIEDIIADKVYKRIEPMLMKLEQLLIENMLDNEEVAETNDKAKGD